MDPIIQIQNGTHQIIVQVSDPNTIWLVIATSIIAGVTFFGILLSNKRTRESNERAEIEFKVRMKPIFVFVNPKVFWSGAEPNVKARMGFTCLIRNDGVLSARKINVKIIQTNNTKIEDVIKEFPSNLRSIQINPIPRNHTEPFNYVKIESSKGIYFALWFDYVYFNEIRDQTLALIPLTVDQDIIPIWYDYDDIRERMKME